MQLQDYALGHMEDKTNLGYVKRGCGTSATNTHFTVTGKRSTFILTFDALAISGLFCQLLFVWIVSAVLLKTAFKEYAQKTFTSSYDVYGMFWGTSTTAALILVVLHGVYVATARAYFLEKNMIGWFHMYPMLLSFAPLFNAAIELPVALYIASRAVVAVPFIFKCPATLLCCGRKRRAEIFVTAIVLWVDMVALQLVLFQVVAIAFTITTAPFAIVTNAMLVVLALSCLANIFSLLYTIFAHLGTPTDQRVHSSSMVLRALVVLPLLLMIMCYSVVATSMGSVVNIDAKKDNALSFISSIMTPILLGMAGFFLKRCISTWLKWSPQEIEKGTEESPKQDAGDELLHH